MTRKDYLAAAKIVREILQRAPSSTDCKTEGALVRRAFEGFFANDNPRFNPQTFRKACEPKEVQETDWWI